MKLFHKKDYADVVELSIGKVFIKNLKNGVFNKVTAKSTIYGDVLNNAYFFMLMDYELIDLSKKQIDKLSIEDGNKVRLKVKEHLAKKGLLNIKVETSTSDANGFTNEELVEFKRQEEEMKKKYEKR